jgi:lysophospholipase L1-like esterase
MARMRQRLGLILFLVLAAVPAVADDSSFALKDGDRVVFYGDSITDQRLYTTYTESYIVTRFPKLNISFVHSGWSGDRVTGGGGGPIDVRLARDVIAYKPTVVTIMLGMNDASYRPFDQAIFDTYADGYRHIVESLKQALPGVRLTLIGPSPFDDVTRAPAFEGGYNAVLMRYAQFVKELAEKEGATYADLNTSVVEATKKADAANHELALRLNPDRVHPGLGGQLLMATALLRTWNAPALVSLVEIDGDKVVRSENTKVTDLKTDGSITWTQEDAALPMPIDLKDPVVALAVKSSDVMKDLNQEILKLSNAPSPEYTLKIDGEDIGSFTREQLGNGVNLAELSTPMSRQAAEVHRHTLQHNDIHFNRWRSVQVSLQDFDAEKVNRATDALDAIEADSVAQQRKVAQPHPHRFELVPKS